MASPFSFLKAHTLKADKEAKEDVRLQVEYGVIPNTKEAKEELYYQRFDIHAKRALKEIELMKRMKSIIQEEFMELISNNGTQSHHYMITIRPSDKAVFEIFKDKVEKLVRRSCFINWSYSFEQKGTSEETMGNGFHVHIVAQMKQRSKGEVLRDITSSFKDWINDGLIMNNCINVRVTKNPDTLVQNYLIDYKSDDGHKETTRYWDTIWREAKIIDSIYKNPAQ